MIDKKEIHVRIDKTIHHELKLIAKQNDESMSYTIERILNQYIESKRESEMNPQVLNVMGKMIQSQNSLTNLIKDVIQNQEINNQKVERLNNILFELNELIGGIDNEQKEN